MRKNELKTQVESAFLIFLPVTAITDSELDLILFRYIPIESDASKAALSERTYFFQNLLFIYLLVIQFYLTNVKEN